MRDKSRQFLYEDACPECGVFKLRRKSQLGNKCISCAQKKHGLRNHYLYKVLASMKSRCTYPNNKRYEDYGGRGIKICEEWVNSPEAFISWALVNGYEPGLQIDRINNDGDYSPENCRFVTREVNCRNRRDNLKEVKVIEIKILFNGGFKQSEICKMIGIHPSTVNSIVRGINWGNVLV